MSARGRALITGLGVLSPLGCDWPSFAAAIRRGSASIASPFPAAEASEPVLCHLLSDPEILASGGRGRQDEPLSTLATAAVRQALTDAGVPLGNEPLDEVGLVMSTVLGPSTAVESYLEQLQARGPRAARPAHFVDTLLSMPASRVGIALRLRGSTAVMGGSSAFELALDWVRGGREHTVVAGAGECQSPKCLRYFRSLAEQSGGERPHLAQGAGFVVLEEAGHAAERGVAWRGELMGAGGSSEPQNVALPWSSNPECEAVARAMGAALADAEVPPEEVQFIALAAGDDTFEAQERAAIRAVFGQHTSSISLLRPKRLFGEALGASSGLGLMAMLADLDGRSTGDGTTALVNNFEMGGTTTSLVLRTTSP